MTTTNTTVSTETKGAVVATALLAFCGILSETSMNVTFATLSDVFQLPLSALQWVTTAYLLAVAITMTTSATLKHNVQERIIFTLAFAFFALGSLLAIATSLFPIIIAGRVLQGIGTGLAMPLMFNIIAERVPKNHIGLYMGIGGLIMGLAPAFGPTYGGFMIASFAWQWIFIAILPVAGLSFIIGLRYLENSPVPATKRPFNWLTFLLLAISLSALLLATTSLEAGQLNWTYVLVAGVSLMAFTFLNLKDPQPFLDIRLLKNPIVLFGLLPFAIFQFANLSVNFVIPNFLTMGLGLASSLAGFALLPGTLLGSLTVPFLGKLYDTKGAHLSLYLGNALFFCAMLLLCLFTNQLTLWTVVAIYILFTFGRNMAFNNTMAAVLSQVSQAKSADITAIFQMIQQFAGAFGTAISAVIVEGGHSIQAGSQNVFWLMLVLIVTNFLSFRTMFHKFR